MTTMQFLIVSVWVASGLLSALLMGRRGHRHWYWTLLAIVLGPLAWPVLAERRHGDAPHVVQVSTGQQGPGLHLLAGIDGSEDSAHAARVAVDLLRGSLGQVTLATVVDYDTEGYDTDLTPPGALDAVARARFHATPELLREWEPAEAVLAGPPAAALLGFAAEHDVDVIVVGPRGHGFTERLLGSVSSGLVSTSSVPVLVIGGRTPSEDAGRDRRSGRAGRFAGR